MSDTETEGAGSCKWAKGSLTLIAAVRLALAEISNIVCDTGTSKAPMNPLLPYGRSDQSISITEITRCKTLPDDESEITYSLIREIFSEIFTQQAPRHRQYPNVQRRGQSPTLRSGPRRTNENSKFRSGHATTLEN